nr:MAG: capsid protein [Cressdnaviricota sp.]
MGYGSRSNRIGVISPATFYGGVSRKRKLPNPPPRKKKYTKKIKRNSAQYKSLMTMTKNKSKHCRVKQDGTGTSRSMVYIKHKSNYGKLIKGLKNVQLYDLFETFVAGSTVGAQGYTSGTGMFKWNDITTIFNETSDARSGATQANLFPTWQGSQKAFKVYLQSVEQYLTFTNADNANMTLDLYDVVARHDRSTTVTPDQDWLNGLKFDQAGAAASGQISFGSPNTAYQVPTNSKLFNQYWKIRRVTHIDLAQGRSHEHIIKFNANRILDMERCQGSNVIGGLTSYTLIVSRGMPTVVPTTSTATLTPSQVPCVVRTQYKWRMIDSLPSLYNGSGTLPTPAVNTIQVVSEGSGVKALYDAVS